MKRSTHRTPEQRAILYKQFEELVASGLGKKAAAAQLFVPYATMLTWQGREKPKDDFPIVSAGVVRPYVKKVKPTGKAIVIVTDISSLSSVLSNL